MPAQCSAEQLEFSCVERRRVVAAFDGGTPPPARVHRRLPPVKRGGALSRFTNQRLITFN